MYNKLYMDRDMSWLLFDKRIVNLAINNTIPLYERIKMLSISDTNLREFVNVRLPAFAVERNKNKLVDPMLDEMEHLRWMQSLALKVITNDLYEHDIMVVLSDEELSKYNKRVIRDAYENLGIDSSGLCKLSKYKPKQTLSLAIMCSSFFRHKVYILELDEFPPLVRILNNVYVPIEILVRNHIKTIISSYRRIEVIAIYPILDYSEYLIHNEYYTMLERAERLDSVRKNSRVLNLMVNECSLPMIKRLDKHFEPLVITVNEELDYPRYNYIELSKKHRYKTFSPNNIDCDIPFEDMPYLDTILHHPFDTFKSVISFIETACVNPRVKEIRISLYRVSGINSPIIKALKMAHNLGKLVKVLIEPSARFSERDNTKIGDYLEDLGIIVNYGVQYVKVHAKMCICTVADDDDNIYHIAHVSTGNYNEVTAKIYTDISYFTADQDICNELHMLFDYLCVVDRDFNVNEYRYIYVSPYDICEQLMGDIDNEILARRNNQECGIFIKVNSLCDQRIVDKLDEARSHGVPIFIVCRGPCLFLAGGSAIVKSVVGRFLEHSRIFKFTNQGDPIYLIGSADLLTRNLNDRFEILVPVCDEECMNKLEHIITTYMKHDTNTFLMGEDGKYMRPTSYFNIHNPDVFVSYEEF